METDLVSLLFDSFILSIQSFIANDVSVMLLGMLYLIFMIFAFSKIREFLDMSSEARDAKSAFERYQAHKDDWRAPLFKAEYEEKFAAYEKSERPDEMSERRDKFLAQLKKR